MDASAHAAYTRALVHALEARPDVLGVILLGSTAGTHHAPDAHSDHDVFVVARPDAAEAYRASAAWLPDRGVRVVHHRRDTAHGARAVYADGHLLEYAVFTPQELALSVNHHARIALDRVGDLPRRLAPTLPPADPPPADVAGLLSDLWVHLLVGVGRHARGEHLAAHHHVRALAVHDHLKLLHALVPPADPAHVDARNAWRRVETTHPQHAAALGAALALPLPAAAGHLLDLAGAWWGGHPAWSADTGRAVRSRIEASGRPAR